MRVGRRLCVTRKQPIALNHEWWPMEAITGSMIRSASGGSPMVVSGGTWSIAGSGVSGNRISKSTQTSADIVYTNSKLSLWDLNSDFTFLAWTWPESSDLTSDGYTKPLLGKSGWTPGPSRSNDMAITCYFGNLHGRIHNTRINAGSSAVSFATFPTVGSLTLIACRYIARSRMASFSKNGATFVNGASTVPAGPVPLDKTRFNLGNYSFGNAADVNSIDGNNRNTRGKWDDVAIIMGKALSDADINWLYNSGSGRTYDVAQAYGLFRR